MLWSSDERASSRALSWLHGTTGTAFALDRGMCAQEDANNHTKGKTKNSCFMPELSVPAEALSFRYEASHRIVGSNLEDVAPTY